MLQISRILPAILLTASTLSGVAKGDSGGGAPDRVLSIGFASQDLQNPVSMFGHTFLISSKNFPPEPSATVIDFVAANNEVAWFALRALAGADKGMIRKATLAQKELEYDREDRDLYFYQLNLDEVGREKLLTEIQGALANPFAFGNYGFFKNNCAFVLFNMVLNAVGRPAPFTIAHVPLRGLKALDEFGLLRRPFATHLSPARQLTSDHARLSGDERATLKFIRRGGDLPGNASAPLKLAARSYAFYRIPREGLESERARLVKFTKVSGSPAGDPAIDPLQRFRADWFVLQAGYDWRGGGPLAELTYIPTIRHSLNFEQDDFRFSKLIMGRINLALRGKKFILSDLALFELDSIPLDLPVKPSIARYFRIGYDYWRGIEARWAMGPSVASERFAFSVQPLIGLKGAGQKEGTALRQPVCPQLGLRARGGWMPSPQTLFSFTAEQLFFRSFRPEFRLEGEFAWRLQQWTPFVRFRLLRPMGEGAQQDVSIGVGVGI